MTTPTSLSLSVQYADKIKRLSSLPVRSQIRRWALAAHQGAGRIGLITVRYVDEPEGRALNKDYRGKDYATNVLTFAQDAADCAQQGVDYAADIIICAPVIAREAREQKKPLLHHHAHMTMHGILHAQGFEHDDETEAEAMEAIEIALLRRFRIKSPYE